MDGTKAVAELNTEGVLKFTAGEEQIELAPEDLLIETSSDDNLVAESDGGVTVVLDTVLTDELIEEGFVLELTSKIQTMRKEAGFEVMDRIIVYADGNERIEKILKTTRIADRGCRSG
jgi:isoleucyl-tRNA synthetase